MAIPLMEEDVEVISKLGDNPGGDNGLTPSQLKGRFDLAAVRIKKFINETLVPNLNALVDVQALLNNILDKTLSKEDKAANAKATGEAIATAMQKANAALPRSGGAMSGGINMNGQQLTGIPTPTTSAGAVPKGYVDTKTVTITLKADGWIGDIVPFMQTIVVEGLKDENTAHGMPVYSGVLEEDLAIMDACACISFAKRNGANVTFYCLQGKPDTDIPISVEVGV